ncbi:hypothetical protein FKM82_004180 [Ascaphus truei]
MKKKISQVHQCTIQGGHFISFRLDYGCIHAPFLTSALFNQAAKIQATSNNLSQSSISPTCIRCHFESLLSVVCM